MKKIVLIFIIVFSIISCNQKTEIIEGDLYFKLIDFGSFYGGEKDRIVKFEKAIDSLRHEKMISEDELKIIEFYDKLKKHKLIYLPCIKIKTDTIIRQIYLTEPEYEKVKDYKWSDLRTRKKKVKLTIEIQELEKNIFFSDIIIEYKELDGQTYWKK